MHRVFIKCLSVRILDASNRILVLNKWHRRLVLSSRILILSKLCRAQLYHERIFPTVNDRILLSFCLARLRLNLVFNSFAQIHTVCFFVVWFDFSKHSSEWEKEKNEGEDPKSKWVSGWWKFSCRNNSYGEASQLGRWNGKQWIRRWASFQRP